MDTAILVGDLDKSAVKLVEALNAEDFKFTFAALMKTIETDDWYLVLGIPELRTKSSRNDLVIIYNLIKDKKLDLTLNDIKLIDDREITVMLLKQRYHTNKDMSRTVLTGNYIEGVRIPDSIIYQIK